MQNVSVAVSFFSEEDESPIQNSTAAADSMTTAVEDTLNKAAEPTQPVTSQEVENVETETMDVSQSASPIEETEKQSSQLETQVDKPQETDNKIATKNTEAIAANPESVKEEVSEVTEDSGGQDSPAADTNYKQAQAAEVATSTEISTEATAATNTTSTDEKEKKDEQSHKQSEEAAAGETPSQLQPVVKKENPEETDDKSDTTPPEEPPARSLRPRKVERQDAEDSQDSQASSISCKEDDEKPWEPWKPTAPGEKSGWHLICQVQEDWEHLAGMLDSSTVRCERTLLRIIRDDFLPEIPTIQEEKVGVVLIKRL